MFQGICWRALVAAAVVLVCGAALARAQNVTVVPKEAERRVDVLVDGQPFTSYIWPETLKKPVLYPLRTAAGTIVTRGYPLDPRPGERVDHPHHVGLWFNYGDVNGLDFWNNSDAVKPADRGKMGTIRHLRVKRAANGKGKGELVVESEWVGPDGKALLREETEYVFHAGRAGARAIDRVTKLTAVNGPVSFRDNKEGVLGLRVARELEHPSKEPLIFTDAEGRPTSVAKLDNTGVTGRYTSSEGKEGDDVWGTRGRWTMLAGTMNNRPVTLAILDHPQNVGHPTYWHARGYGLYAANPLGQRVFSTDKKEPQVRELNYQLAAGKTVTFRHRILLLDAPATSTQLEEQYRQFTAGTK